MFSYIKRNYIEIFITILLAISINFLGEKIKYFKYLSDIFTNDSYIYQISLSCLIVVLLLVFRKKIRIDWKRYKNTYELKNIDLIVVDYAGLLIFFTLLLYVVRHGVYEKITLAFLIGITADFILFLIIANGIGAKKELVNFRKEHSLLDDSPIEEYGDDLLNRKEFVNRFVKEIEELKFIDSFVYGLQGVWGEGKTSVLHLLKNKLNENTLIVEYDPWYFRDQEAIIAGFFSQLESAIAKNYMVPNLKSFIRKYKRLIEKGVGPAAPIFDIFTIKETPEEVKNRIESFAIKKLRKKIVVFVDNIDRLDKRESELVFKLVRLCSNFRNTVFILSLDPAIVTKRMDLENGYLEKIIQRPINLPAIEKRFIDAFVELSLSGELYYDYIFPIFSEIDENIAEKFIIEKDDGNFYFKKGLQRLDFNLIDDVEKRQKAWFLWKTSQSSIFDTIGLSDNELKTNYKDFGYFYHKHIKVHLTTLRKVKRFLNGLIITLPSIYHEIHLLDFMGLEILRLFYPNLYRDIWINAWIYIPTDWSVEMLATSRHFMKKEDKYAYIKKHIDTQLEKMHDFEKKGVRELLEEIFCIEVKNAYTTGGGYVTYSSHYYRSGKRITHPDCFKKYFSYMTPLVEIEDKFIIELLRKWRGMCEQELKTNIKEIFEKMQKANKLRELFDKIVIFLNEIDENVALMLTKVIYEYSHKFSNKDKKDFFSSELDKGIRCLLNLVNNKISKDKIHETLVEVVEGTHDYYFLIVIVNDCREAKKGELYKIHEVVKFDELRIRAARRLEDYFITSDHNIINEYPGREFNVILWYWARNWEELIKRNDKVKEYVLKLFKIDKLNVGRYLSRNAQPAMRDEKITFEMDKLDLLIGEYEIYKYAKLYPKDGDDVVIIERYIEIFERRKETKNNIVKP